MRKGQERIWDLFRLRLLEPLLEGTAPVPYRELFLRLGFQSEAEAGNALITAKRVFQRALRQVVAEYAPTDQAVETEIRELMEVLSLG